MPLLLDSLYVAVVEDEPLIRQMIIERLRKNGFARVDGFANGQEAFDRCYDQMKSKPYDLVITDLKVPGLTGLELITKLRDENSYSATPMVIVTGHSDSGLIKKAIEVGVTQYLLKPFSMGDLDKKVNRALENPPVAKAKK